MCWSKGRRAWQRRGRSSGWPTGLEGSFARIQCTPDLMPADLIGTQVFRPGDGDFAFVAGAGVPSLGAGRRDQPCAAQGAVGPAGGDGRGSGDGRRHDPAPARPLHGRGDPERDRERRNVSRCRRRSWTGSCCMSSRPARGGGGARDPRSGRGGEVWRSRRAGADPPDGRSVWMRRRPRWQRSILRRR